MKKIQIIKDGPYVVTDDVKLVNAKINVDEAGIPQNWGVGKKYPNEKELHLCRCGRSMNKPYCDGAHLKMKFDGTETADHGDVEVAVYQGEALDLLDLESYCASLRFCDRGIRLWDAAIKSGNKANKQLAIEEACDCAAGRMIIRQKDGELIEPKLNQEISPIQDTARGMRGPLWVKGGIELIGADGKKYKVRNRMTLCRCGESRNMPFCDTSHVFCKHMKGFDE